MMFLVRQTRSMSQIYKYNTIYPRSYVGNLAGSNTLGTPLEKSKVNPLHYQSDTLYIDSDSGYPCNLNSVSLKIQQNVQCNCELLFSHHKNVEHSARHVDTSLTPYSFSDNSRDLSPEELQKLVSSQNIQANRLLEQFLSLYSSKYVNNKNTINTNQDFDNVENSKEKNVSPFTPAGNQLDDMFGVENNLYSNIISKTELNETRDDNFLYVTELLNNYLHSAGECISNIFVTEKGDNAMDDAVDDALSNEQLHNIENPLEAYAHCLLEANGNMHNEIDFSLLNYVPSVKRDELNQAKGETKPFVSPSDIVYFSTPENSSNKNLQSNDDGDRPTKDQLLNLQDFLVDMVPLILSKMHEYKIYKPDLIFENNWVQEPYVSQGLVSYSLQLLRLRWRVNIRYANVRVSVLKSTIHEDEGSVKIRWRMSGLPQGRVLQFWKFLPWNYRENLNQESVYYDGLSTLYVASSGHVYKHRVDRVIPDDEVAAVVEEDKKVNLVEKLKKIATPPAPAPTLTK